MAVITLFRKIRDRLFGTVPGRTVPARRRGKAMAKKLQEAGGDLEALPDAELIALVEYLLTNRSLRRPLRGSVQFVESVAVQYRRKGRISAKQRRGLLNVLERAYPHNLASELR